MNVETKSTGQLVDELITTSVKMFVIQDQIPTLPDAQAGEKAKQLQSLNARRNALIQAIDKRTASPSATTTDKTYQ